MPTPRTAKKTASSRSPASQVTIHPRIAPEEYLMVKAMAEQFHLPEMAIWRECASDGLLISLIKHGPDERGLYGNRWTAKELAQIARRRIMNLLIDFQMEHDELPALLTNYLETLQTLAAKPQSFMVADNLPPSQAQEPATEEDALVFAADTVADVTASLAGMGFNLVGLVPTSSSDEDQHA